MPGPVALLSSWKLSVVLLVLLATYHVMLAGWAFTSPAMIVRAIAGLVPFWAVWLLLFVNIGFCLWRRLPVFVREVSAKSLAERARPRWQLALGSEADETAVRRKLRALGYRCRGREQPGLVGVRGRFGALGTVLFHLSMFVVAVGFFVTMAFRSEATATVAVGETLTADPEQLRGGGRVVASEAFRLDGMTPTFWQNQLLFTSLTADVLLAGGDRVEMEINRPLWVGFGDFVRLTNFGYAPAYKLSDRQGRLLDAAIVKLRIFPPGSRDHFTPAGLPHRVYLEVYPDAPDVNATRTDSLNLVNPLLVVRVTRGKLIVAEKRMRLGEAIEFEGLTLRFPEIRYFGEFELLSDPGAPIIFGGLGLAFLGLLLRLRGRRAEIVWVPGPGGQGGQLRGFGFADRPEDAHEDDGAEGAP